MNELNQELLIRLQESGVAVPSSTVLNGRFAVRVSITNHRSRREDFEILVRKVKELGKQLLEGESSHALRMAERGLQNQHRSGSA